MNRKWHQKKRYIILSLLLFPPLGIPLVWLSKWHQNIKIGASVASTLLLMVALAAPPEESKTANSSQVKQTPTTEVESSIAEESTQESTQESTEESTEESQPEATAVESDTPKTSGKYITKDGYMATFTEEDLDKLTRYANQGDKAAFVSMVQEGRAFPLKPGLEVYLERCIGFTCSTAELRPAGQTVTIFTVHEAFDRAD
jgi:hypothetical protein